MTFDFVDFSPTLGNYDVVRLTGDVVHSTVAIGRSVRGCSVIGSQTDFEGVRRVLDAAVSRLLPDTDGVVLVSEMFPSSKVVALQRSSDSSEPLSTT